MFSFLLDKFFSKYTQTLKHPPPDPTRHPKSKQTILKITMYGILGHIVTLKNKQKSVQRVLQRIAFSINTSVNRIGPKNIALSDMILQYKIFF